MARKPSSSHRGSRPPDAASQDRRTRRASTIGRSRRAKRSDEQVWTPDQPAATRGRSDRAPGQRGGLGSHLAGGRDGDTDLENLRTGEGGGETGATETSSERQGMGRGHRRNFDESDDDATTRGQSTADATSDARDSGVRRRSRAMDDSTPRPRSSPPGGRSTGRRSDW